MKTIILLFLISFSCSLYSYTPHSSDTSNHSALSLGSGPLFLKGSVKTYYLFSFDYNLHTYEEIYFDFGLSTITDFHNYGFALQISPNLKFNALKNKLSFFLGSGFFSTISEFPGIGVTFYLKFQYNFKNNMSLGFVYNHSIIFEERDKQDILMNPGIYFSLQL